MLDLFISGCCCLGGFSFGSECFEIEPQVAKAGLKLEPLTLLPSPLR